MRCCRSTASRFYSELSSCCMQPFPDGASDHPGCMQVSSFGVNGHVKLPGASQREPNVYDFGTSYRDIFEDLQRKDEELYSRKGLLQVLAVGAAVAWCMQAWACVTAGWPAQMLKRNMGVKSAPERWQDNRDVFDVIVTFEERIMEQLLDGRRPQDDDDHIACTVVVLAWPLTEPPCCVQT